LFDEIAGGGATLIVDQEERLADVDPAHRIALSEHGVRVIALATHSERGGIVDLEGSLSDWLNEYGAVVALVRPDFYLFGTADHEGVGALIDRFFVELKETTHA